MEIYFYQTSKMIRTYLSLFFKIMLTILMMLLFFHTILVDSNVFTHIHKTLIFLLLKTLIFLLMIIIVVLLISSLPFNQDVLLKPRKLPNIYMMIRSITSTNILFINTFHILIYLLILNMLSYLSHQTRNHKATKKPYNIPSGCKLLLMSLIP